MKAIPSEFLAVDWEDEPLEFIVDNIGYTEIRKSDIHGKGLFALKNFYQGEVLCWLNGQVIDWRSYNEILATNPYGKQNVFFKEWNALSINTLLVRPFRTKYSFINHGTTPNLIIQYDPIRVVALQQILPGDELILDYRCEPLSNEYKKRSHYLR